MAIGIAGLALAVGVFLVPGVQAQSSHASEKNEAKNISGSVLDKNDAPLGGAVVYLKNTKTLGVKTYIADDAGQFRFNSLSPNVDYEVYAEYNGQRSGTRTISSFDSRTNVQLTLKVDVKK